MTEKKKEAAKRIYRVDGQDGPRLVEAKTSVAALNYVASTTLTVRLASQLDLYEAGKNGAEVEDAHAAALTCEAAEHADASA